MAGAAPAVQGASTQIPGADQYASAEVMANNAYNNALAQLNSQRLNTLTSYGYTGNVDPHTGVIGGVHVDPNAVYGQLQQMLHGDAQADHNAQLAVEDRGLFGGLANQARTATHYAEGADATALGTSLENALAGYQQQQQADAETRDNALWQAEQQALDAELQAEQSDTLDQLLTGGYGGAGTTGSHSGGSGGSSGGSTGSTGSQHYPVAGRPANPNNPDGPRRGYGNVRNRAIQKIMHNKRRRG